MMMMRVFKKNPHALALSTWHSNWLVPNNRPFSHMLSGRFLSGRSYWQ
jgi:hypothetical protein